MTPGIPGAGIGGLFYLAATMLLAVQQGWRRVFRRSTDNDSRGIGALGALALGIAAGVWLTGWMLGYAVSHDVLELGRASVSKTFADGGRVRNAIRVAAVLAGVVTLAAVLIGVEIVRVWHRSAPAHTVAARRGREEAL